MINGEIKPGLPGKAFIGIVIACLVTIAITVIILVSKKSISEDPVYPDFSSPQSAPVPAPTPVLTTASW